MPTLTRDTPLRPLRFKRRRRSIAAAIVTLATAVAIGGGGFLYLARQSDPEHDDRVRLVRACDLPTEVLERVWRGYVPERSGEVLAMELEPNQFGTRHSTPYAYTQDVPLVLYGPGFVRSGKTVERPVTLADLAPTMAELLQFDAWPQRDGSVLEEALLPRGERNGVPRLIVTIVWDGGGDNVLRQWPDSWPNLADLMEQGTSFDNATVGSSPSITPSVHATIGTGAWPSHHGLSDTRMRVRGRTVDAWEGSSPRYLRLDTIGDLWDAANGNEPLVGMLARDAWHLGMIGHGAYLSGADKDIAVLDQLGGIEFRTNPDYYSLPKYLLGLEGLSEAVAEYDARDGEADKQWLGNPLLEFDGQIRFTPPWNNYQTLKILELLQGEGFGTDEVPDLFYTNYKSTDLAGHFWNMVEPEVRDDLAEQDAQLPILITALDTLVGRDNYVLALTADHGMTPFPTVTKGWSIETRDMTEDILEEFDHETPDVPLVLSNRGYQIMLDEDEMRRNDVTPGQVAEFVRDYRIEDNITPTNKVLLRFEGRTDERLFLTALTPEALKKALDCSRNTS